MLEKIIIFNQKQEFLAEVVFKDSIFQQFILNDKGNKYLEYWFEEWRLHGISEFKFYFNTITQENRGWSSINNFSLHNDNFIQFFKKWLLENSFLFFSIPKEAWELWHLLEQVQKIDLSILLNLGANLKYLKSKNIITWKKRIESELTKSQVDQAKISKIINKMTKEIL